MYLHQVTFLKLVGATDIIHLSFLSGIRDLIIVDLFNSTLAFILALVQMHWYGLAKQVGDRHIIHMRSLSGIKQLIMENLIIFSSGVHIGARPKAQILM